MLEMVDRSQNCRARCEVYLIVRQLPSGRCSAGGSVMLEEKATCDVKLARVFPRVVGSWLSLFRQHCLVFHKSNDIIRSFQRMTYYLC